LVLYLGDHDASRLQIEEKLGIRLDERSKMQRKRLDTVRRIALTREQVDQFELPPSHSTLHNSGDH
jgi:hypothetical protein